MKPQHHNDNLLENIPERFSRGILNTSRPDQIKEYIHNLTKIEFIDPSNDLSQSLIPYEIGGEEGTIVLKGEITSYSDYKNVIDQLNDLKRWRQIEFLFVTYKNVRNIGRSCFFWY